MNWMRKNSLWPMPMGLACCAIELMATAASRFDIARFGSEVMRFSPRQCDVMIVAGTVTYKMALAVKRIWEQMPEPKWCIAMGACASSGGMYRSYAVLQGIDQLIPVDVYILRVSPSPGSTSGRIDSLAEKNRGRTVVFESEAKAYSRAYARNGAANSAEASSILRWRHRRTLRPRVRSYESVRFLLDENRNKIDSTTEVRI